MLIAGWVDRFTPMGIPGLLDDDGMWIKGGGVVVEDHGIGKIVGSAAGFEAQGCGGFVGVDQAGAEQGE